jgi:hypothetical protein
LSVSLRFVRRFQREISKLRGGDTKKENPNKLMIDRSQF